MAPLLGQRLERQLDAVTHTHIGRQRLQGGRRLLVVVAQGQQRLKDVRLGIAGSVGGCTNVCAHLALELQQQALLALGYNDKEAAAALKALPADVGVSEGIKLALKSLNR